MATIKIIDSGLEKYSLKSDTNVLGRMYDNNAEAVDIIIPEAEAESVCYANVVSCDGEVIDRIKIENNSLPIKSNLSQYCEIYIGFSFIRPNGTEKQSEQLKFGFLYAIKPKDFTPEQSDTEKALAKLIASGFVKLIQDGDTVKFYNWQDIVVGTIYHEGINGFEIVNELPTENIDTHTIYLVKETVGEADDYYNEYIYINGEWELLGSTRIDLNDYYTKDQVDKITETLTGVFNEKVDIINKNIDKKLDKQTAQTTSDQIYGKLADGSQTMFDVTMGATATTIPRRDTAGRIQVADGVSGNDAVNFNQLSAVEASVINSLDKEHIAYVNKENTFTKRQRIVTPYDSDINTQEEGFIDAGIINVSRIKYTNDTKQYYTDNDAILNARYLQLKQQIKNESGLTQHIIQLDHDGIKQVDYDNNSNTNYGYIFPKTYPNKEVTLATIEDLTAQFGALNIQNGSGIKSIQQKFDPKYNGVVKAASKNPYAKVLYPELTDAEPIGAIGDYAASFGGNSSVQAKRGIGGGTSSVTKGAYSQSFGDNTVTTPKASDSTAIGYQTTTDAPAAFTHGSYTVVMSQKYTEGMFDPSVEPGQGGSGQPTEPGTTPADTLEMDTRRGEAASAGGFNSYASGFAAEVDGVSNVADGHISKSSGRSNRSWSYLSKTDGKNSVVKPDQTNENATGEGSWANGDNIQIIGAKYAYSGGSNNTVFAGADNSFSYGEGLQVRGKNQTVIGQYNDNNSDNIFEIGIGTTNLRRTSFRATRDGRVYYGDFEVSNLETTNAAIVGLDNKLSPKINSNIDEITNLWATLRETNTNLNRLNEQKYDKTGGVIGGDVIITGDLTVNGTQHINNTENLNVENAMIYSNATGATLATNGGIGIKKNATDVYGIVYDSTSDSVKLGLGESNANGVFTFNENEGQPVAIRDDSSKFTNNNLVKWDSESYKFVDSGKKIDDLIAATNLENGTGDVLIQTTDSNQSFKVMTDGRAKVQSAPAENDDVLRLNELSVLTQEQVNSLF